MSVRNCSKDDKYIKEILIIELSYSTHTKPGKALAFFTRLT